MIIKVEESLLGIKVKADGFGRILLTTMSGFYSQDFEPDDENERFIPYRDEIRKMPLEVGDSFTHAIDINASRFLLIPTEDFAKKIGARHVFVTLDTDERGVVIVINVNDAEYRVPARSPERIFGLISWVLKEAGYAFNTEISS